MSQKEKTRKSRGHIMRHGLLLDVGHCGCGPEEDKMSSSAKSPTGAPQKRLRSSPSSLTWLGGLLLARQSQRDGACRGLRCLGGVGGLIRRRQVSAGCSLKIMLKD